MRQVANAVDRIDYLIRRYIVACAPPSDTARDRSLALQPQASRENLR